MKKNWSTIIMLVVHIACVVFCTASAITSDDMTIKILASISSNCWAVCIGLDVARLV